MTPTESLLKELEELEAKATPGPWRREYTDGITAFIETEGEECILIEEGYGFAKHSDFLLVSKSRNSLPALLQIIRTQREELERMAKVDVSLLSNELAAAWALRHWVFARDALSRCDEIAKGVKG